MDLARFLDARPSDREVLKRARLDCQDEELPYASEREVGLEGANLLKWRPDIASAGERMAAALERLATSHSAASFEDPLAWQREIRKDRQLLNRD
jgi:hypothetical protein